MWKYCLRQGQQKTKLKNSKALTVRTSELENLTISEKIRYWSELGKPSTATSRVTTMVSSARPQVEKCHGLRRSICAIFVIMFAMIGELWHVSVSKNMKSKLTIHKRLLENAKLSLTRLSFIPVAWKIKLIFINNCNKSTKSCQKCLWHQIKQ